MKITLPIQSCLKANLMRHARFLFLVLFSLSAHVLMAQLTVTLTPFQTVCEGESIQLMPTISGGDGSYTYSWGGVFLDNPFSQNPIASPVATTNYTVNVTDGNGLTGFAVTTITVATINIIQENIQASCFDENNGSISLMTVPEGLNFLWNNGAIEAEIDGLPPSIYCVTITDFTNGCSIQTCYTINELPEITLQVNTTDVDCNGNFTGAIDLTISGGIPPYNYLWTGPNDFTSTVEDVFVSEGGSYIVTVVDNHGCTDTGTFTINEPSPLQISSSTTFATCGASDGNIDVFISGGTPPYAFQWSNGTTTQSLTNIPAGIYSITATDANNCFVAVEIQVGNDTDLIAEAGADILIICEGDNVTLNATAVSGTGAYTYAWSNGANTAMTTVDPLESTTYFVTVTDALGCISIDEVVVTVNLPPVIEFNNFVIACNGEMSGELWIINPLPTYAYNWSTGATTPSISNLAPGTYCLTITDFNGCDNEACFTIVEPAPINAVVSGLPTDECDNDFTLEATVTGGNAPYTFIWSGPNGLASTTSMLVGIDLENGIYNLGVTDANGCETFQQFEINQAVPPFVYPDLYTADCTTAPNTASVAILENPQFTVQWIDPDGVVFDGSNFPNTAVGTYTITLTNIDFPECPRSTSMMLHDYNGGIIVNLSDCNTYTLEPLEHPFEGLAFFETLWTLPDGSNSTTENITVTETGLYTLVITYPNNCTFHAAQYIDLESENCSTLEGYVRFDESENCIVENTEIGIPDIVVTATDNNFIYNAITDEQGYYRMNVPASVYTVTHSLPTPSWAACEASYFVDLTVAGTLDTLDIPIQGIGLCPELSVTLSSLNLRRCFTSNYFLTVCNEGTESALMAEVVLVLDEFLSFNNTSMTPNSINGQQINWAIDEMVPGDCITIEVWVTVSCDAVLGQIHCTEAFASNYPFCGSADGWSGANLEINAVCEDNEVTFNIQNSGLGDLTESINYIIIEDAIAMMEAAGTIDDLPSSAETSVSFPANGSTYTFILEQAPNHPYTTSISSSVEGCGLNDTGSFSTGFVNQFNQQTSTPTSTILCLENTGSFDPNDKKTIPVGYSDAHYITPEDKINYQIRFQNTGTDTAFTVVVRDSLSEFLDISTFQSGNSSHDYRLEVSGEKILTFTFNNILLPDSTTNLEGSNGFVDFSILPKSDAPLETLIENKAAIYFDFNDPVITNTVFHTLGRDFYDIVNWINLSTVQLSLNVYPNPASDKIRLGLENIQIDQQIIRILDMNGRQIYQSSFSTTKMLIDIQQWPSNWYAIQLLDKNGILLGSGRLVKQ